MVIALIVAEHGIGAEVGDLQQASIARLAKVQNIYDVPKIAVLRPLVSKLRDERPILILSACSPVYDEQPFCGLPALFRRTRKVLTR